MANNKFNIGDKVWLRLPDSDVGVVQDVIYRFSTNTYEYSICFGWDCYANCEEHELITSKTFN